VLADYLAIAYWLLIATGAALALGTGAALLTFRRTGRFPGHDGTSAPSTRTAVGKVAVGVALMVVGASNLLLRVGL
jgi:uncharacterized membrane protein